MSKKTASISEKYLPAFVYGGIDGLVTTFAVVSGAAGANLSVRVVLILGFANLFADGLSMSIGAYLAGNSVKDNRVKPFLTALTTFVSFNILGIIPLLFYIIGYFYDMNLKDDFLYASIATGIGFLIIGSIRLYVEKDKWAVVQTLLLGAVAAGVAYWVGDFLEGIIV